MKALINARNILTEKGWNRFFLATDKTGNPVVLQSKNAISYCIIGAISKAEPDQTLRHAAIQHLLKFVPPQYHGINEFNDAKETSKPDVLDLFDRAIASEKQYLT